MAAISLQNIVKRYGHGPKANPVLHGISAEIADGEFIVIVGPSGCGKSTLLRMVAGLEEISEGEICIAGRVVNDVEPADRDIAMVFQNYALYPHMSVFDNMAYGLKIAKVPKAEIAQRVNKAAGILELAPFLQRTPRQLSGGQRQRVAMGRAIVRQPKAFLFDEPLSNLDAKLRVEMRAEIKLLHQRTRTTTVYVTHDQVEAMTLGDRIAVMKDGVLQQFGTPDDIYARPATKFVAEFIGSPAMNLVKAQRALGGGITAHAVPLPVSASQAAALQSNAAGTDVIYGLRPEDLQITAVEGSPMVGTVTMLEPTGPETYVTLDTPAGRWVTRVPGRVVQSLGERVGLSWDPEHTHLFDEVSEQRIG